jgi:hypothetical protein
MDDRDETTDPPAGQESSWQRTSRDLEEMRILAEQWPTTAAIAADLFAECQRTGRPVEDLLDDHDALLDFLAARKRRLEFELAKRGQQPEE